MTTGTVIYKCSCGAYHPWAFDGDCRDDDNRYSSPEEYAEENGLDPDDIEVRAIDAEDDEVDDGEDDGELMKMTTKTMMMTMTMTTNDDDDDQDEDEVSEELSGAGAIRHVCELSRASKRRDFALEETTPVPFLAAHSDRSRYSDWVDHLSNCHSTQRGPCQKTNLTS